MELPSSRELELENLVRSRDKQLAELQDEVRLLRQYLAVQPGPSTSNPTTLPPAFTSLLLPHLTAAASTGQPAASGSYTVTAALTQRAKLLQEENDELYEILRHGETGKMKEEVRGLRRVVEKLESALQDSHQLINSLSAELDKTYDAFLQLSRQANSNNPQKSRNYHAPASQSDATGNGHSTSKNPPTGPRAHKKPRLSEPRGTPPRSVPPQSHKNSNYNNLPSRNPSVREYPAAAPENSRPNTNHVKAEGEDAKRNKAHAVGDRERGRDRERERGQKGRVGDRERDRDRDVSRNAHSQRSNFSTGAGRGAGPSNRRTDRSTTSTNHLLAGGDRTLAERMGL